MADRGQLERWALDRLVHRLPRHRFTRPLSQNDPFLTGPFGIWRGRRREMATADLMTHGIHYHVVIPTRTGGKRASMGNSTRKRPAEASRAAPDANGAGWVPAMTGRASVVLAGPNQLLLIGVKQILEASDRFRVVSQAPRASWP